MEKWMQEYGLGRAKQEKGLFASLFILQNRLHPLCKLHRFQQR